MNNISAKIIGFISPKIHLRFLLLFCLLSICCFPQFGPQQTILSPYSPRSLEKADMDNDGYIDLIYTQYTSTTNGDVARWIKNLGNGTFSNQSNLIVNTLNWPGHAYPADFDADGDCDILTSSVNSYTIVWAENLGGGVFGPAQTIFSNAFSVGIHRPADIDGDGDIDVLTSTANSDYGWCENLGGGTFASYSPISLSPGKMGLMEPIDVDKDGLPDLVVAADGSGGHFSWYKNLGGAVFSTQHLIYNSVTDPRNIIGNDMDNDGDIDLLVSSRIAGVCLFKNDGTNSFLAPFYFPNSNSGSYFVTVADVDNDNDLDVISDGGVAKKIFLNKNLGNGTFGTHINIGSPVDVTFGLVTDDFDGDGDQDLISESFWDNKIALYNNQTNRITKITGNVFFDTNQNGIKDSQEDELNNVPIMSNPFVSSTLSGLNGNYSLSLGGPIGSYNISANCMDLWNTTSSPSSYNISINTNYALVNNVNFGIIPDTIVNRLNSELIGGFPQLGRTVNYYIDVKNSGTTTPSGTIAFELDTSLTFLNSSIVPDSVSNNIIYWHFDSLFYFSNSKIRLHAQISGNSAVGDSLKNYSTISVDSAGNAILILKDTLIQLIQGTFSSFDNTNFPLGVGATGVLSSADTSIEYVIRFQNITPDTLFSFKIISRLDNDFDWKSFSLLASSLPVNFSVNQNGVVQFDLNNAFLPDSSSSFVESQGFIKYKVSLKQGVLPNSSIENIANISFDHSCLCASAYLTNVTVNTTNNLPTNSSTNDGKYKEDFCCIYPNPSTGIFQIKNDDLKITAIEIYNVLGEKIYASTKNAESVLTIDISNQAKGIYFVNVFWGEKMSVQKIIVQ